ncbi:MAG: hypothetical protein ABI890_16420 [Lapillicoccus sp.]
MLRVDRRCVRAAYGHPEKLGEGEGVRSGGHQLTFVDEVVVRGVSDDDLEAVRPRRVDLVAERSQVEPLDAGGVLTQNCEVPRLQLARPA